MKFDGYAMDYVQFPEGMDWFLQSSVGLHRVVRLGRRSS